MVIGHNVGKVREEEGSTAEVYKNKVEMEK